MALRVYLCLAAITCVFLGFTSGLTQDEKTFIVEKHNEYRREVGKSLPDLVWDEKLATEAQAWAETCKYWHRKEQWGENIGYDDDNAPKTVKEALEKNLKMWMVEKQFNKDGSFDCCSLKKQNCCHYSQVLWKETSAVGCGINKCHTMNDGIYVVCYYLPPGNIAGEKPY